ncbi:MAG TPA: SDR family oxidoreductase [Nocardioides sp.]|uniref:SDR family oxidoreductase n=1 Tax=Nocardioides sp. TaxID=35761 RepID=UPI002E30A7B1|nr:SDR family oxidoreductase [Nocardioides sp.]HEX3931375.1 SDR family oxidoreductase [Nocardioides sp.]
MTGSARTYVITGASDGIGLECASQLARAEPGCRLVLVGRDPRRTEAAAGRIRTESPGVVVDPMLCDLSSQDAVRRLAGDLLETCDRIDVLVNNAGTVFARRTLTADGIEATFAVNHLAGFLLTELLLDRILQSAPARIVFTSSEGHYSGTLDFDDLGFEHGYSVMKAYSRSKLANVLTARALARRLDGTGVTVTSLHPGAIATNIWSGAPWFARPVLAVLKRRMESPATGGSRLAHLAASPDVEGETGGYYDHDRLREPSVLARDDALADRLHDVSAGLVGLSTSRGSA